MSRIGRQPIPVPEGVKLEIRPDGVTITGPLATITYPIPEGVVAEHDEKARLLSVRRTAETKQIRALHGTSRSRLAGILEGVSKGFEKRLEIGGVGYQARLQGEKLELQVGFSHPVEVDVPEGLKVEVPAANAIKVSGPDKQKVGQFAAEIRSVRPPEPYNAKGIRYAGEHIRRKQGKTFAGGE
jgi:large subunit ribosomal protein L6